MMEMIGEDLEKGFGSFSAWVIIWTVGQKNAHSHNKITTFI